MDDNNRKVQQSSSQLSEESLNDVSGGVMFSPKETEEAWMDTIGIPHRGNRRMRPGGHKMDNHGNKNK